MLDDIKRTPVDPTALRAATREYEHGRVAFDLLREAAFWTIALGSAVVGEHDDWSLEEAIIGGHYVRLAKLTNALMQQTAESRSELAWVTSRLLTECVINVKYLLANASDDLFRSYIMHSLQHDRQLMATIERNIEARSGERLPIETRMLKSIARTFANVGLRPEDLPTKRMQNWDNKTLKEKAESLGMSDVYQVSIGASSRDVHGSWYDLTQHHLERLPSGRYRPRFEEARVRPQILYAMAVLIGSACLSFVEYFEPENASSLRERLIELDDRIRLADSIHEQFITDRRKGAV